MIWWILFLSSSINAKKRPTGDDHEINPSTTFSPIDLSHIDFMPVVEAVEEKKSTNWRRSFISLINSMMGVESDQPPNFELLDRRKRKYRQAKRFRAEVPLAAPSEDQFLFEPIFKNYERKRIIQINKKRSKSCPLPDDVEKGLIGKRRRGRGRVANGIFCSDGVYERSRCIFSCQKGTRLSDPTKKFRCVCSGDDCSWSIDITKVECLTKIP
jgi:hypothetical protein